MKNIILAVTVAVAIFASNGAFARGFSVGVLGSYGIDNGAIQKTADAEMQVMYPEKGYKIESLNIVGISSFIQYDFKKNLFLRSGFEYNTNINSEYFNYDYDGVDRRKENKEIEYSAYSIPIYFGITLSPDRGKTSVYTGAGIVYSKINIEKNSYYYEDIGNDSFVDSEYTQHSESETDFIGYSGIFGLERNIFSNIYLVLEYAFYAGEEINEEKGNGYDILNDIYNDFNYIERYGLPTQQLRVGLKYDF
jgi:opacity protein-like surface antigen